MKSPNEAVIGKQIPELIIHQCWKPDCRNVATGRDGSGWEWCDEHFDQEKTGSVLHIKQVSYDSKYYRNKVVQELTTAKTEAYEQGKSDGKKQILEQVLEKQFQQIVTVDDIKTIAEEYGVILE